MVENDIFLGDFVNKSMFLWGTLNTVKGSTQNTVNFKNRKGKQL